MIINTNTTAVRAARLLSESSAKLSDSLARLSSGSKIVNASDDSAGLAQVLKLDAQMKRTDAASANVGNAISYSQTQDGFLQKVQTALERMSELTVLGQDVTKSNTDRSNYNVEFQQLQNYISDMGGKTFNGVTLFGSDLNANDRMHVTIDSNAASFAMAAIDMATSAVGVGLEEIYNASTTSLAVSYTHLTLPTKA